MAPNKLSAHFTEEELNIQYEDINKRLNAKYLCDKFLEPVHDHYNKPIHITSAYRNPIRNKHVGGKETSWHLYLDGRAAVDFFISGIQIVDVFDWIRMLSNQEELFKRPIFDKIIMERNKNHIPVIIHVQLSRFEEPRRTAWIGETGDYKNYIQVDCL